MNALKLLPFVIAVALAGCGEKTAAPKEEPAVSAPATEAAPAQAPAVEAPAEAPAAAAPAATGNVDLAKGEQVYGANCVACHGGGVMGAPKLGDKAAWEPRIAKGVDTLHANAIKGLNLMPPKGGNPALTDDDLKAAVGYMLSKVS